MNDQLTAVLTAAQSGMDAARWQTAIRLYQKAEQLAPSSASIKHNLALASFAVADMTAAEVYASAALKMQPDLWQSAAVLARTFRATSRPGEAEAVWTRVLGHSLGRGAALLGLADLALNEFGDAAGAVALAGKAKGDAHAADAELTRLMAELYAGGTPAGQLSAELQAFSMSQLNVLPRAPLRPVNRARKRIGLISPLFSASPVYFLTYSTWQRIAEKHDLIFFGRGSRSDWASESFASIATEWHDVSHLEAEALAGLILGADIEVLFDLGGWADPIGLAALSAKPAQRMYKWIGGQSATTGLNAFDGWIGDRWQSPKRLQPLYTERLIEVDGGYCDYTPPPYLKSMAPASGRGVGLVANPAKIVPATLANWPNGVDAVRLIDRRYRHERTVSRVTELLNRAGVRVSDVIVPDSHRTYLKALGSCEAIVNTQPYSAGLTAVEALWLGVRVIESGTPGELFCSRHHLSHMQTGGRNPALADQILSLVSG